MNGKKKFRIAVFFRRLAFAGAGIYVSLCGLLYFAQEKLLFHPRPFSQHFADSLTRTFITKANPLSLKMNDNTRIAGWFVTDNSPDTPIIKKPLIIYYPGNAEEVSHLVNKKDSCPGFHAALFNYRGYGISEGEPSEEKFFSDALTIFDAMKKRPDVDTNNIFVIGRSIGTGVAVHVCKNRKVQGCVLITPYESIADVAAERYPAFPVKLLIKHPFNSVSQAEKINTPVLCYIASEDEVIPPAHAHKLMEKWKGKKTVTSFAGAAHNSIMNEKNYWKGIVEFLNAQKQ